MSQYKYRSLALDRNVSRSYREFIPNKVFEEFSGKLEIDQSSKVYFVTVTFRPNRFHSNKWSGSTGGHRRKTITEASSELFQQYGYWWLNGLHRMIPNFNRPNKAVLHPHCYTFIDDMKDDEPYPHIHAVVWVPSATVSRFEKWAGLTEGNGPALAVCRKTWYKIEGKAKIDIQPGFSQLETLKKAVFYASKYHDHQLQRGAGEELMRRFPEKGTRQPHVPVKLLSNMKEGEGSHPTRRFMT